MKRAIAVLIFPLLFACSSKPTQQEQSAVQPQSDGKSFSVVVSGVLRNDKAGKAFFLMPREEGEAFTPKEERCAEQIASALELSGFHGVKERKKADLLVGVRFPRAARASDLTLTALLGGWRHSVEIEARDQKKKLAWSLEGYSESDSEDIRSVFPYIATAMVGRFGKEPMAERVAVDELDPRVEKVKGGKQ